MQEYARTIANPVIVRQFRRKQWGSAMAYDQAPVDVPRYRAFISYSHADAPFAAWLHRKLEAWRLPDGTRLAPIFIDRAELPAGPDLPAQVRAALERSDNLIVIASPAARASHWVAQEIALFREHFPDRPVLTALIDGEPVDAFPAPLTEHAGRVHEPLAADFRKGQDGRRLGLLKIVAGLSGLPLDRLVQRDAQARQRRVMLVTAAALILSLVLAALLVAAQRARAEAQRQRAEAEGMVEFMLTDLRDRLKGVGRLDIMDAVNERAMERYRKEQDLSDLPADMLLRRARLLHAMAEDDLSSVSRKERGKAKAAEALRITHDLLARAPNSAERLFAHGQSEYYVGQIAFDADDGGGTERHWLRYLDIAKRLTALEPSKIEWQRELSYAYGNMCAAYLAKPPRAKRALAHCVSASEMAKTVWDKLRNDINAGTDLANRLAWEADVHKQLGDKEQTLALRQSENRLTAELVSRFPGDARALEAQMRSDIGLARAFASLGDQAAARRTAVHGLAIAENLRKHDPENRTWKNWKQMLDELSSGTTPQE